MNRFSTFAYTIMAGIFSTIVFGAIKTLTGPFGIPTLTFPFCFTSWIFCLAGSSIGCVFAVDISAISIPEDNIKRFKLVQSLV